MQTFKRKQPADYSNPYQNMLADINAQITELQKKKRILPNYILLSTTDYPHMVKAAQAAKMIPSKVNELTIIQSARLMPSEFMPVGSFDVVGN